MHVESRNFRGEAQGDIDDFIIDNVVIVYKIPDVSWTLPSTTGDLAAFVKTELLPSITNVKGSGATADPADQHNEYVLPTASQLAAWRAVFQSLLAGSWAPAQATFIITGGQDNIQAVAGQLLTFFSEVGFHFPQFPFIAHSRGWDAEDMERNAEAVEQSESLRDGARQLVTRGAAMATLLLGQGAGVESTPRGGRKASPLGWLDK